MELGYKSCDINENLVKALEKSNDLFVELHKQNKFNEAEILTKAKNQILSAIKNISKLY